MKLQRLKEIEDETKLSKKTSFSSFYNLEEENVDGARSQAKLKEVDAPKHRNPKHPLTAMLCARPQTAKVPPRSNSTLNKKIKRV